MAKSLKQLSQKLGYHFKNPALLLQAMTHRSAAKENNERLEFLGDSILNFIIADLLYGYFPEAQEGKLSRIRSTLVKEDSLAELARELEIGSYLVLGLGELKSGGCYRTSILADAFEAVIGAIYLDNGLEACRQLIELLYRDRLAALTSESVLKDPKTRLQEYLQARQLPLPDYRINAVSGESHERIFQVQCIIDNFPSRIGTGYSRRKAEQDAATQILELLLLRDKNTDD
ncbi:ribonuclease III [Candidatus Nitrosoglobus terrae]|uniref:Ribonuclease 3 n=1 Tax=Candidatus Nitrosoglobus terrae TaxID=1630141 RepID=A0A1Q2SP03_9GAMM|nr:ribonuclease III [Candidatus Nitrosoglobus terrae]BAW80851.1 ribonuclease III [Candidatus Nitrosoglobus terrae]